MDNVDIKKALFGFGIGAFLFYAGIKLFTKKDAPATVAPMATPDNTAVAIRAYQAAIDDKASNAALIELNAELAKQFGVRCILRNGRIVATDLAGKELQS